MLLLLRSLHILGFRALVELGSSHLQSNRTTSCKASMPTYIPLAPFLGACAPRMIKRAFKAACSYEHSKPQHARVCARVREMQRAA